MSGVAKDLIVRTCGRWSRAGNGNQPGNEGGGFEPANFDATEFEFGGVRRIFDEEGARYLLPRRGVYLVTATLMLSHTAPDAPFGIRFRLDNAALQPARQWAFYSPAADYVSWCVSAVLPVTGDDVLRVEWQGTIELVAREVFGGMMGIECSWLEVTRIGDAPFPAPPSRRCRLIGGGGGGTA